MAFLHKGKKEDIIELATELGIEASLLNVRIKINKLFTEKKIFSEDDAKVFLGRIIEERI